VKLPENVHDIPELRERIRVFRNRAHAGKVLAVMLGHLHKTDAVILAIPAGGVPVAAEMARILELPLDVAAVSKITFPWNTEAGFGAVAFDGTVRLNEEIIAGTGLSEGEIRERTEATLAKVKRRVEEFRGSASFSALEGRPAVLVDDGLASGVTVLAGIEALRKCGVERATVAVPTGAANTVRRVARETDELYCANIRSGFFAVAEAYGRWSDVTEEEVKQLLKRE